jgi:hypothetical protein
MNPAKLLFPRVTRLVYAVVWECNDFRVSRNASPLEGTLQEFDITLNSDLLNAVPRTDFASTEEARASLEPLLADWQTEWDIKHNLRISFKFISAEIRDLRTGEVADVISVHSEGSLSVELGQFPALPSGDLRSTRFGNQLRSRLHNLDDGREGLCACAYYVLTAIEREFSGPKNAARTLALSVNILENIGRLSSINDPELGRKGKEPETSLDPNEIGWMKLVLRTIVTRVIELQSGLKPARQITMADLKEKLG